MMCSDDINIDIVFCLLTQHAITHISSRVLLHCQGFIQAVLLMPIFKRRLSFQMLYFVKKDYKIV